MEYNYSEEIVVPETPKVVPNEALYVYVPKMPFNKDHFIIDDETRIISLSKSYTQSFDLPFEIGTSENSVQQVENNADGDNSIALGYSTSAISKGAHSEGIETLAGVKGYYWTDIDFNNKTITLSATQFDLTPIDTPIKWAIGDKISIVNDDRYDNCSTIVDINDNIITVDALPFTSILTPDVLDFDDYSVINLNSPSYGIADFGGGSGAHAEGYGSIAINEDAHAEGIYTRAIGRASHAEGMTTTAYYCAHAEGKDTHANNYQAHAEGIHTVADGDSSHAEGRLAKASGPHSHAEGYSTFAGNDGSHAEGKNTQAINYQAHAEGNATISNGDSSHAEGRETTASGDYSHAEGYLTVSSGPSSHAEGRETTASGDYSHAEGYLTVVNNGYGHAEGKETIASGWQSHAEGRGTVASGNTSHAEGRETTASGDYSHAAGRSTNAKAAYQTALGVYNADNSKALLIVGNGTSDTKRSNAFAVISDNGAAISIGNTVLTESSLLKLLALI